MGWGGLTGTRSCLSGLKPLPLLDLLVGQSGECFLSGTEEADELAQVVPVRRGRRMLMQGLEWSPSEPGALGSSRCGSDGSSLGPVLSLGYGVPSLRGCGQDRSRGLATGSSLRCWEGLAAGQVWGTS